MREWLVGGAVIEDGGDVLLVQNRRRDGTHEWSTPGGVVDPGETMLEALGREVTEETGLVVERWRGPLWTTEVLAPDMGWHLRVEVHLAVGQSGEISVDDPDGIVVDAAFVDLEECDRCLRTAWTPTHEPMLAWLSDRWSDTRTYRYEVRGADRASMAVVRLEPENPNSRSQ